MVLVAMLSMLVFFQDPKNLVPRLSQIGSYFLTVSALNFTLVRPLTPKPKT